MRKAICVKFLNLEAGNCQNLIEVILVFRVLLSLANLARSLWKIMKTISTFEAKNKLSELIASAERGEPQIITKNGRKSAV